jgi:cytochrome b561
MPANHTRTATALHWLIAAGVLTQFCLGWWMRTLPDKTGVQAAWFNLHKSIGLTVFVLVVALIAWRLAHPVAPLPDTLPRWQRRAARATHLMMYACLVVMPVTGYMGSSFTRFPIRYWGVALPNFWGWDAPALKALCSLIHLYTVCIFMALVALHVAAAFRHLARGDGLFLRMWSWNRGKGCQGASP